MKENLNELLENPNDIKRTTNKREKTSWVWRYFDIEICNSEQFAICNLEIMGINILCKKEYKTGGSTKNCIEHLTNTHELFSEQNNISQTKKITKKHNESRQLELHQFLVDFILDTAQLLRIVERISFYKLIYELDPKFNMPDSKSVKAMIHIAYNYTFKVLTNLLELITSVSLTLDL
ncbi:hypothetical protein C1645_835845 [Glomus cerebriforme]|uniref:BED-type domain-containing protein n=1 Tax=Glomus cerebriforme TaxID=658196 RepID=A0A397S6Y8_9GLOM|nr:hypothetical protein C1645_835845 [Glomus cerebriforme]